MISGEVIAFFDVFVPRRRPSGQEFDLTRKSDGLGITKFFVVNTGAF